MTFSELLDNGLEAFLANNFYQAANLFESAIKLQPNSVRARICLIMVKIELAEKDQELLSLLKELDYSESIISRGMSNDTKLEFGGKDQNEFLRGRCCFFLGVMEEAVERRHSKYKDQAMEHWRKALEINPEHNGAKNFLDKYGVKKSGCFIATAAFGTPLAEEVLILSNFRDESLSRRPWGRKLISFYYDVSPSLASLIIGKKTLCWIVRSTLILPLVKLVKK